MNRERKRKSVRICGLFFSCLHLLVYGATPQGVAAAFLRKAPQAGLLRAPLEDFPALAQSASGMGALRRRLLERGSSTRSSWPWESGSGGGEAVRRGEVAEILFRLLP
jgi:hypothetical protein